MGSASSKTGSTSEAPASPFVTTHWSIVLAAGRSDSLGSSVALEELCRTYWHPLYAYVRRRGYGVSEAQDLTQEFFARFLEKDWVTRANPAKGKFRSFLLSALNHFLCNEWRRSQALKHGGGVAHISIDDTAETWYAAEPSSDLTPEKLYEKRWALSVFDHALHRLKQQYVSNGRGAVFEALQGFLSTEADSAARFAAASKLSMSPGAVATAVHRLRQQYREQVRQEVAQTVTSSEELEDEMRALVAALS